MMSFLHCVQDWPAESNEPFLSEAEEPVLSEAEGTTKDLNAKSKNALPLIRVNAIASGTIVDPALGE